MGLIRAVIVNHNNINKICRICLEEKRNITSFLTIVQFKDDPLLETSLLNILSRLSSDLIQNEDNFPRQICLDCTSLIKAAYIFKLKFEEATDILNNVLSSMVKDEENSINQDRHICDIDSDLEIQDVREDKFTTTELILEDVNIYGTSNNDQDKDIQLNNHEKYLYKKPTLYPCPICTVELPVLELKQHAHNHTALKKYLNIPKLKNVKFFAEPRCSKSLFQQPVVLHKCPHCNDFFSAQQFKIHIDTHRKQGEFKCFKCNRVFRKLNHLNTHRIKHLKEYPYKCNYCGKGFVIRNNYDCHMLTHTHIELPHECSYCLKRFSNPKHLHRHQIIHTENISYSVKYKVLKCRHCLKHFKDKDNLKKHICLPVEQVVKTRFPCQSCNKVFRRSSGLYNHVRNIHKLKDKRTLCSVCGYYVSNIYNHMMRHSGEKPYNCNQCDKRFAGKPQLRQHLLVHSGVKPYVCSVCAKAFNNLYNLQVHERIHRGDKCHICPICSKGFLEKSYLKKHLNVHKNVN